ncbi:MAG: RDD family protein, partial [Arcobacteraceae bacterium]
MSNIDNVEYAGFWIRVGASFIDGLLFAIFTLPITMIVYGDTLWESESMILGPADFLINYVLPAVVVVLFWLYKSATPGKMIFKLKVVDATTGNVLTVGQAIGRYLAYFLASIPLLLGIIWIVFDNKKQGWHDKLANTAVIRD